MKWSEVVEFAGALLILALDVSNLFNFRWLICLLLAIFTYLMQALHFKIIKNNYKFEASSPPLLNIKMAKNKKSQKAKKAAAQKLHQ